eukprot:4627502-Karenia_brevis.AAC.1
MSFMLVAVQRWCSLARVTTLALHSTPVMALVVAAVITTFLMALALIRAYSGSGSGGTSSVRGCNIVGAGVDGSGLGLGSGGDKSRSRSHS